jgi:hypothetical protein
MEWVDGLPITTFFNNNRLTISERLEASTVFIKDVLHRVLQRVSMHIKAFEVVSRKIPMIRLVYLQANLVKRVNSPWFLMFACLGI